MTDIMEVYYYDLPIFEHMLARNLLLPHCNVITMDSF